MSRTTSSNVQDVLGRDYDFKNSPSLTPYIDIAGAMVDDLVTSLSNRGLTSLTATRLELIERWLAAHYYAVSDKTFKSKSTEGASASFNGNTDMYLEATLYGQQAIRLDNSGYLQAMGGKVMKIAGGFWLGKNPSEQIAYTDRR